MPFETPSPNPTVTVIVVNYNGGGMILRCLDALQQQSYSNLKTIVVDNHSSDNSIDAIRRQYPWVRLLTLPVNKGFAGGVNHALHDDATTELVALLNPDAFPCPDWLQALVEASWRHRDYAAFGSRMFCDEALHTLDGVGDVYHASGLPWRQGHGQTDSTQYDQCLEIFAPCAAAALYRTDVLRQIGCFDEDFFLYVEDVDVGFRMRLAGYKSMYVPSAKVWHVGSGIVGKHSASQIYHGHRNLVWAFVKNMPSLLFWLLLPLHIALNIATVFWFTVKGQGRVIRKSKRDAIAGLPLAWAKRRVIQSERRASTSAIATALRWSILHRRYR